MSSALLNNNCINDRKIGKSAADAFGDCKICQSKSTGIHYGNLY
jgi:hypothetical protein